MTMLLFARQVAKAKVTVESGPFSCHVLQAKIGSLKGKLLIFYNVSKLSGDPSCRTNKLSILYFFSDAPTKPIVTIHCKLSISRVKALQNVDRFTNYLIAYILVVRIVSVRMIKIFYHDCSPTVGTFHES